MLNVTKLAFIDFVLCSQVRSCLYRPATSVVDAATNSLHCSLSSAVRLSSFMLFSQTLIHRRLFEVFFNTVCSSLCFSSSGSLLLGCRWYTVILSSFVHSTITCLSHFSCPCIILLLRSLLGLLTLLQDFIIKLWSLCNWAIIFLAAQFHRHRAFFSIIFGNSTWLISHNRMLTRQELSSLVLRCRVQTNISSGHLYKIIYFADPRITWMILNGYLTGLQACNEMHCMFVLYHSFFTMNDHH